MEKKSHRPAFRRRYNPCGQAGFTLLEMALVLLIGAFMVLGVYATFFKLMKFTPGEQQGQDVQIALAEHVRVFGHLPAPASMNAVPGDADYGVADAGAAMAIAGGDVLIGTVPIRDLQIALDCRDPEAGDPVPLAEVRRTDMTSVQALLDDKNNDGNPDDGDRDANRNLTRSLCVYDSHMYDEYGSKLIYAVTAAAIDENTFDPFDPAQGRIRIIDQNGNQATRNDQLFVVLNVGEDRKGGIAFDGTPNGPACGTPAGALDNENCDMDRVFRNMPKLAGGGGNHFDDELDFSLAGNMREDDHWQWQGTDNISFNTNSRMIIDHNAVGLANPLDRLVINGADLATGMGLRITDALTLERDGASDGAHIESENVGDPVNNVAVPQVTGDAGFVAQQFCYDPPMTSACGAP